MDFLGSNNSLQVLGYNLGEKLDYYSLGKFGQKTIPHVDKLGSEQIRDAAMKETTEEFI